MGSGPRARRTSSLGLSEAVKALEQADATRRNIILLTDGWSRSGEYDEIFAHEGRRDHALDGRRGRRRRTFLEQLAKQGGGRYYAAANPASIPDIFLKETQQVAGQQIVEEEFFPIQTRARRSCAASRTACRSSSATTGPRPSRPRSRARLAARRSAPRAVAVRAGAVRGLDL